MQMAGTEETGSGLCASAFPSDAEFVNSQLGELLQG